MGARCLSVVHAVAAAVHKIDLNSTMDIEHIPYLLCVCLARESSRTAVVGS